MAVSLCTFTPESGPAVSLGTEDCWIEVTPIEGGVEYTVHSNFVDRSGNRFYVEGSSRGAAEVYARELAAALGTISRFKTYPSAIGSILVPPTYGVSGTLSNPYTGFSVDNAYLSAIRHDDRGGRYYGIDITFTVPSYSVEDVPAESLIMYKGVPIGNLPGHWSENPDANFLTIEVVSGYYGDDEKYLSGLADLLGFEPTFATALMRGLPGNRGVVKGYFAQSGELAWGATSHSGAYLTRMNGRRDIGGLLELSTTFVIPR